MEKILVLDFGGQYNQLIPSNKLAAVANAKNRHTDFKNVFCIMRGGHIKNGIRTTREYDTLVVFRFGIRKD